MSIITLTTDFGYKDYFVGSMKGVVLRINPHAQVIDISHEVEPYNVAAAAYLVKASYPYFPEGTIHVVVVDPGVGSTRRPILVEGDGSYFVGPDNGVFTYIYQEVKRVRIIHLTSQEYFFIPAWQKALGSTFHGRDIFAPVAAWLSKGIDPLKFGEEIREPVKLSLAEPRWVEDGTLEGRIIYIDRFGNLITNITRTHYPAANVPPKADETDQWPVTSVKVILKGKVLALKHFYAEGKPGEPCALMNSCGHLEVFINLGNAQQQFQASVGDPVMARVKE
jgi:S-adenosylmethionine hydrolase